MFGVLGLVVGGLVIGWTVLGGSAAHVSIATSASTPPGSPALLAAASTPEATAVPTPEATPAETIGPAIPTPAPTAIPTAEPSPEPTQQPGLVFDFPLDGDVVSVRDINMIGTAPPGSTVTRDIPMSFDDHTVTRSDGIWTLPVHLGDGENVLRLRIGDDRSTEQVVTVLYQP
jgi:hypothetical protein